MTYAKHRDCCTQSFNRRGSARILYSMLQWKKSMVGPGEKKTDKKSQVAFYAQTVIFMSNSEPTLKYLLL